MPFPDLVRRPAVKLLLKAAGAAVVVLLIWALIAKGPGEPCSSNWDCLGLGAVCLRSPDAPSGSFCSKRCDGAADCPERWRCEETPVLPGGSFAVELRKVCLLP